MDNEIQAMSALSDALSELDDAARARVLRWAADRFGVTLALNTKVSKAAPTTEGNGDAADGDGDGVDNKNSGQPTEEFETFAELFAQANPSTESLKVLVAGYWHQVVCSDGDLSSAKLNKDLKDLGHSIVNINQKFDSLMAAKPQLAIQLKKSGNSKQARKQYKITKAGISKVEEMLRGVK